MHATDVKDFRGFIMFRVTQFNARFSKHEKRLAKDDPSAIVHRVSCIFYSTVTLIPSECALNSGAYRHWMDVIPLENSPFCVTFSGYSKTYVPLRR